MLAEGPRPSSQENPLSVQLMFQYDNRQNDPFQFPEYQPLRDYEAPKDKPSAVKTATKKGFYMDYELKVAAGVPSSQHYQHVELESPKQKSPKIDKQLKKYSYLDLIQSEQKLRKTPAPGDYHLFQSAKQLADQQVKLDARCRKRRISDKRYFYEDFEHLSVVNPGPGNYNPRPISRKLKLNKKDHTFWVEKHQTERKSFITKRKKDPDMGSYTPIPVDVGTFDGFFRSEKQQKKNKSTSKPWGTAERFSYSRPKTARTGTKEKRPEPGTYDMILDWPAKPHPKLKAKQHPNDWINKLSRSTSSVYH